MIDNILDAPQGTTLAAAEDAAGIIHLIVILRDDQIERIAKAVADELEQRCSGNPTPP